MKLSSLTLVLKRFCISLIGLIYIVSTTASGFQFFPIESVYAQGSGEHQDLVALVVDEGVYNAIQGDLNWYVTTYIPSQSPDTQVLVLPIIAPNFKPKDIQRILENLYFEGSRTNSSTLKGVILFGDIPLPSVAMDDEILQSIYPYVDFEEPMFEYNELNDVFEFTSNAGSLPELRHSTILSNDVSVFSAFFSKLKEYYASPTDYAAAKIRYDDFPFLKQSYTDQELDRYINTLLFADSHEDRHTNSMFSRLINKTYEEGFAEIIRSADEENQQLQTQALNDESIQGDPEVEAAASEIFVGLSTVLDRLDPTVLEENDIDTGEYPIPTKLLETQMQDEFKSNAEIFGATYMETVLENIAAGGRYQLEDIDTSLEKMDLMDRVNKAFVRDMNETLQNGLDAVIDHNDYSLKYPLPYRQSNRETWKFGGECGGVFVDEPYDASFLGLVFDGPERESLKDVFKGKVLNQGDFLGLPISSGGNPIFGTQLKQSGATAYENARVENHYFGKNAVDIISYDELTIYRGSYANQTKVQTVRDLAYDTYEDQLDDVESFDIEKMSIGGSLGYNSVQTQNNRAFNFNRATQPRLQGTQNDFHVSDKELYDEFKCDDEQELDEFSKLFWGGASVFNLDADAMQSAPRYPITKGDFTDRDQAWNPTNNRSIGGPWYDPAGAVLVQEEITKESLHENAHRDWSSPTILRQENKRDRLERTLSPRGYANINDSKINHCIPRDVLESYDAIDYFNVYDTVFPEGNRGWVGITVQPTLGYAEDGDSDGIPLLADDDADGDLISNLEDDDLDGDRTPNEDDMNMDGDYQINGLDTDTDGDGIPNAIDPDVNNDGVLNIDDDDVDQDYLENGIDVDVDGDQESNATDLDVDGDGQENIDDNDVDGDGLTNDDPLETDIDGDTIENEHDRSCNGGGCNGGSKDPDGDGKESGDPEENDNDGDGKENDEDPDIDGDGIPNADDGDIDGDGLLNAEDSDMDGDQIPNDSDPDRDADGLENNDDPTPNGPVLNDSSVPLTPAGELCSGENNDIDEDGIPNKDDRDIDGDGYHNAIDPDIDGDGVPNGDDRDIDCDGKPNDEDSDMDADDVPNSGDGDCDGDGVPNSEDSDIDADGLDNNDPNETDTDGDGEPNGSDPDIDGDGLQNDDPAELDIDADGQADTIDTDIDGDGMPNNEDGDIDGDGLPNEQDPDADGDGVLNNEDDSQGGTPGGDLNQQDNQEEIEDNDDVIVLAEQEFFDAEQLSSNREDRGDHTCFKEGQDYRYQIIDSVVHHRNPDSQEVDMDSTIMTFERPIDDNPYVTFHGIGGEQVTMIYPDLYNIPIYDCNLLDPEDIENTILTYLREKVQWYNGLLDAELARAPSHYATHPAAFDFLETVDPTATPNREYDLIDEDFFVDLMGEENITRLSYNLHYLSTGRTQRPQAETIGEFLSQSREQFDYNRRMEYVQQAYLNYDEEPFDFDPIVYPTHIEQGVAYEVGFINSDGVDYVGIEEREATLPTPVSTPTNVGNEITPPGAVLAREQGRIQDETCGIPSGEPVPLLKWPKAMQCWFRETLRDPFNFSVQIEIDYDEAFGDSYQGRVGERFDRTVDAGETTFENVKKPVENRLESFVPSVLAQQEEIDPLAQNRVLADQYEPGSEDADTMRGVRYDLSFTLDSSQILTASSEQVRINALTRGVDTTYVFTINQSASDTVCLAYQGRNLCNNSFQTTQRLESGISKLLNFGFIDSTIGKATLQIQVCDGAVCAWHEETIYRGPDMLEQLSVSVPSTQVFPGVSFPIVLEGRDSSGNTVPWTPVPYRLTVENGSFSQQTQRNSIEISSLQDALYEVTPSDTGLPIVLTLEPTVDESSYPSQSVELTQVDGIVQATLQAGRNDGVYKLPDREVGFMTRDENNRVIYNSEILPTLTVELLGVDGSTSQAKLPVSIVNSNPELGILGTPEGSLFTQRDTLIIGDETLTFLPTGRSGVGTFEISGVPGQEAIVLAYEIKHGELASMEINLSTVGAAIGDNVGGQVLLEDSRGNPYSSETPVYLEPTGGFGGVPEVLIVSGGVAQFTGQVEEGGGGGCGGSCSGGAPTQSERDAAQQAQEDQNSENSEDSDNEERTDGGEEGGDESNDGESDSESDIGDEGTESTDGSTDGQDGEGEEGSQDTSGESNDDGSQGGEVCEPVLPLGISPTPNNDSSALPVGEGTLTTSVAYQTPQTVRPSSASDDINIMYLHLGGRPRGNDAQTLQYLTNSKTLAVTTTIRTPGSYTPLVRDVATLTADGKSIPRGIYPQVSKQMHPRAGDVIIDLGYQAGVGTYRVGSSSSFDFIEVGGEYGTLPNKLVYDGEGEFEYGRLTIEDEIIVDFLRGEIASGTTITMIPGSTDEWQVATQQGSYGTLRMHRGLETPLLESIQLTTNEYILREEGNDLVIQTVIPEIKYGTPSFEGREGATQPQSHLGWRSTYAAINEFSQGQTMGQSTLDYASPYHLNIGDPFLTRVKKSRNVIHTDFDEGFGHKVFSDTQSIQDVDMGDIDNDGLLDMIVTSSNGTIRLLYNEGGTDPYSNRGSLMAVADGIKELSVGDTDGDGRDDLIVHSLANTMRVYRNIQGRIDVNGTPVCLDIPFGEYNVAQASQMFVTDLDSSGTVDIVTYDTDGDLKVFYGGGTDVGASYLSNDVVQCDPDWRGRQNMQLIKSFGTTIDSSPIRDETLRHREGLEVTEIPEHSQEFEGGNGGGGEQGDQPNFKKMSSEELKVYTELLMQKAVEDAKSAGDPEDLYNQIDDYIDYVIAVPAGMRPYDQRSVENYGGIRAIDPYPESPRFDVEKRYTDIDGGVLRKGDLVRVDVSVIPVGYSGPATIWDKIPGSWITYKTDFNEIASFESGSLPQGGYEIDWNIGNGYVYRLDIDNVGGGATYSYELQYDGDGYMRIELETEIEDLFVGSTVSDAGSQAYAQGGRDSRLRAYPQDGCYNEFYEFSPGERRVDHTDFLQQESEAYDEFVSEQRDETEAIVTQPTNISPIEDLFGVPSDRANLPKDKREKIKLGALLSGIAGGGGGGVEIDAASYLESRGDKQRDDLRKKFKEDILDLDRANPLKRLGVGTDHTLSKAACGGGSFGTKTCGGGRPIPFNNDLLSPGSFHIMGCKPPGGGSNPFFPDFAGVPIFAVPTEAPIPVRPPIPIGAGGIPPFGPAPKKSLFRTYATWTTSNGLGMSLCFMQYGATNIFPTPFGDIAGNCLVFASRLGPRCEGDNPDGNAATTLPYTTAREVGGSQTLEEGDRDLYEIGVCDDRARAMSPISSPVLGGRVATHGSISSVNYTKSEQEQEYLLGGNELELKIEGGSVKGLVQCLVRNRVEDQAAYIANNALHMQITLVLPNIDTLRENVEQVAILSDREQLRLDREDPTIAQQVTDGKEISAKDTGSGDENERHRISRAFDRTLRDVSGNPFKKVAEFFEEVKIINFEEKTIPIEIPFLYVDDMKRYGYHMQSWLDRNDAILAERGAIGDDIGTVAQAGFGEGTGAVAAQQEVGEQIDRSEAIAEMKRVHQVVERNLQTLKQYEQLPKDLSQLVHSSDQYVAEVIGFVESLLGYITGWLQDNANRFSMRVDVIITLKGIIETRQLLIDFSVERQSKCAKCRQDNYDFYSCKLKLLCVDLPILPIPPFHLPDIIIDLSNINIGIDIALPYFNFVPRKMSLPQLPDLPTPLDTDVDIRIPDIAILPPPPPLPQLPTIDLNANIELPSLPPPPKIPQISPAITAVIKIADLIGSFMCIFKGGIGLVSEENIKPRVEQMTQRSNDIQPFDSLEIKIPQTPIEAYDYKIDAVVDFKADFRQLYDIFDDLSLEWSEFLDEQQNTIRDKIVEVSNSEDFEGVINSPITQGILNGDTGIGNSLNVDIDLQGNTLDPDDLSSLLAMKRSTPHVGGTVDVVKPHLLGGLQALLDDSRLSFLHDDTRKIQRLLTTNREITPNIQGIQDAQNIATEWLQEKRQNYYEQSQLLENYDTFIDTLGVYALTDERARDSLEVSLPLFETDVQTRRLLQSQESPIDSYLKLNNQILDGYDNALETNSPDELRMSSVQHRYLTEQIGELKQGISNALSDDIPRIAQLGALEGERPARPTRSRESPSTLIDMTQFISGFFIKGRDRKYHNVVRWEEQGQERHENQKYTTVDVNNDDEVDIVAWTDHQIHIKYAKQNTSYIRKPGRTGSWIVVGPFDSPQAIADATLENGGWYGSWKIRDAIPNDYSYTRQGQNYSSTSWVWNADPLQEGYLIEVTDHIGTSQSRGRGGPALSDPGRTRYVLVVPEDRILMETDALYLRDRDQEYRINQLIDQGRIIEVLRYDGSNRNALSVLRDQAERWYYGRHTVLRRNRIPVRTGIWYDRYEKIAPWSSAQIVGAQIWGDDELPQVGVTLRRDVTGEEVSQGYALQGYINTTYTLEVQREDNGVVLHNRATVDGEVIKLEAGDTLEIPSIDYNHERQDSITLVAVDQAGNLVEQEITLQILVPTIDLTDIQYTQDAARVFSELNQTIDRGQVKFQRNRHGYREPLNPEEFPVLPTNPEVVGETYSTVDGLDIDDSQDESDNENDASEEQDSDTENQNEDDSQSGEDSANDDESTATQDLPESMPVSCSGGSPHAQLEDEQGNSFSVVLEPDQGTTIDTPVSESSQYEVVVLGSSPSLGEYDGGWCVRTVGENDCIAYISKYGQLLVNEPYRYWLEGQVDLDHLTSQATMQLYENGNTIVEFTFIYLPL